MGWIASKILGWSVARQQAEIVDFVQRVATANSDELGLPVFMAAAYRNLHQRQCGIDLLYPALALRTDPTICFRFSREVIKLQKEKSFVAAGAMMVWLHSLRAMQDHRLRPYGRKLWEELSRGFPYAPDAAANFARDTGERPEIAGYDRIPDGLEQQH